MCVNSRLKVSVALIGVLLAVPVFAKENIKPPKLFSDTSEMKVTLSGPWRTISNYTKEFLIYRIYNLITEYSFRVRPMIVEY